MEVQLRTAYRQLKRRHEPKTAGTKRELLKSIVNNQLAKKLREVDWNLTHVEGLFSRYECIAVDKLLERVKVTLIMDLRHRELREHLELSTKDVGWKDVREEIVNYVERKRDPVDLVGQGHGG